MPGPGHLKITPGTWIMQVLTLVPVLSFIATIYSCLMRNKTRDSQQTEYISVVSNAPPQPMPRESVITKADEDMLLKVLESSRVLLSISNIPLSSDSGYYNVPQPQPPAHYMHSLRGGVRDQAVQRTPKILRQINFCRATECTTKMTISIEIRERLLALRERGTPVRAIAQQLGIGRSTPHRLLSKFSTTGSIRPTPQSGRPRATTREADAQLAQQATDDPFRTATDIHRQLDIPISARCKSRAYSRSLSIL